MRRVEMRGVGTRNERVRRGDMSPREMFIFENLKVYQKALDFSEEICKKASGFPYRYSRIRDQLMGAALSIPLNIAEGCGRRTKKDSNNFYSFARASVFECIPLIEISGRMKLISTELKDNWYQDCQELSKMISGLIKSQSRKYRT
jgi:four helix bundle protein